MKLQLPNVTLLGIDCVSVERLQAAMDASQIGIDFGAVKLLTSLPTDDPRLVTIPHIGNIEDYSRFCVEKLGEYVDTEFVLMVQYDGFVLSADRWEPEFLQYDYIGAPLSTKTWTPLKDGNTLPEYIVGNGGFTLRSKKFLDLCKQFVDEGKMPNLIPEDVALCHWYKTLFEERGMKYAPAELAMRFSVQENYGEYVKPFGFHGFYGKNMDTLIEEHPGYPMKYFLPRIRWGRLMTIKKTFSDIAIEGHAQGSIARGNPDQYSDIDVWLTFRDEDIEGVIERRMEYYAKVGDILHVCEAPQNSPKGGMFSGVIYKTKVGLLVVDYTLCPLSTSYKTDDYKHLFGDIEVPDGKFEYNPERRALPDTYRLDFFISSINGSIKKLARKDEDALGYLLSEYASLKDKYDIAVVPLTDTSDSFDTLNTVIANVMPFATEKQKIALEAILHSAQQLLLV